LGQNGDDNHALPRLSINRPGTAPEEFELSKSPVMVGRVKSNDIVIVGDTAVSREHCRFVQDPEGSSFIVEDLGSSNGTFVNGTSLKTKEPVKLRGGDKVQVGSTLMIFVLDRPSQGAIVKKLKQRFVSVPQPPKEGENEATVFHSDHCVCGRCAAKIPTLGLNPGEKFGCKQCRAVWRMP